MDYNGWWMCLIPTAVIREIGLSMPMFIKWDDAEFGLRAGAAGYPTVTMPGVAVWHVPWTEKDDTVDWQAYFHERNRLISASAALAVRTRWTAGPAQLGEPLRPDGVDAVRHRCADPAGARGRARRP